MEYKKEHNFSSRKDARKWVEALDHSELLQLSDIDILHAADRVFSVKYSNDAKNDEDIQLRDIYRNEFFNNVKTAIIARKIKQEAEQEETAKIVGHVDAVKWFVSVGKEYISALPEESITEVGERLLNIKHPEIQLQELKNAYKCSFFEEVSLLLDYF